MIKKVLTYSVFISVFSFSAISAYAEDKESLEYFRSFPISDKAYKAADQKHYEDAINGLGKALKIMPDNIEYRVSLVNLLISQKRYDDAKQAVDAGFVIYPNDVRLISLDNKIERHRALSAVKNKVEAVKENIDSNIKEVMSPYKVNKGDDHYYEALKLQKSGDKESALVELKTAVKSAPNNYLFNSSLAYAYKDIGDSTNAADYFAKALKIKDDAKLREDYAYTLKDLSRKAEAAEQFILVQQRSSDGEHLQYLKREVRDLQNNFKLYASVTYQDGIARSSNFSSTGQNFYDSMQYGLEGVYDIPSMQKNGHRLQMYGQLFASSNSNSLSFEKDNAQASLGLRYMPIANTEWYIAAARLVKVGSNAINDTQIRTLYSYSDGEDFEYNKDNWKYAVVSTDLSYLINKEETFSTSEARLGRSFKFADKLAISPHAVVAFSYQKTPDNASKDSLEAGIGFSLKSWFGESNFSAPNHSADLIAQWRTQLAGNNDDKSGPLIRFTISY